MAIAMGLTLEAQDLASIFIRVTDGSGAPVGDLGPDDVVIVEDEVPRFTVAVEPVDWPVKLYVLVDNTSHIAPALGQLRDGLQGLLDALPQDVAVEIVTMSPGPRFVERMTTDREDLREAVGRIVPAQSDLSFFLDALLEASNRIIDDDSQHFPMVLLVAGNSRVEVGAYERKMDQLLAQTNAKPATYHVVIWMDPAQRPRGGAIATAQTLVGVEMARITNGQYEQIAASSRLATLLPELGERIAGSDRQQRSQYRVTYQRPVGAGPPQNGIRANLLRVNTQGVLSFDGRMP